MDNRVREMSQRADRKPGGSGSAGLAELLLNWIFTRKYTDEPGQNQAKQRRFVRRTRCKLLLSVKSSRMAGPPVAEPALCAWVPSHLSSIWNECVVSDGVALLSFYRFCYLIFFVYISFTFFKKKKISCHIHFCITQVPKKRPRLHQPLMNIY